MRDTSLRTSAESQVTQGKMPCDDCGSSDAKYIYDDGHSHCFSCGTTVQPEKVDQSVRTSPTSPASKGLLSGSFTDIPSRNLTKATCQKWGVELVELKNGSKGLAFPYYTKERNRVAQKIRTQDKDFLFVGDTRNPGLFGRQLWSSGRKLVITEGELDALSVSQLQNNKWPVVSVPTGAQGAERAVADSLSWVEENFKEVILMFDMDEPGQKAAQKVAALFTPGKCKIASLPMKDANECLVAGRGEDVVNAIWQAKEYRPDGIVTVGDLIPRLDDKPEFGLTLPWSRLTELTYGLKQSQLWVWTSGSGMGKTEFFKDMAAHLIKEHKTKVGVIFLEEEGPDTVIDLAGKLVGKCFNSPDIEYEPEERDEAVSRLADDELLYLYDHFGHDDYNAVKAVVRHMVAGMGCEVVFLDHITAFTDGAGIDSNSKAEKMMKELSSMTRELKFNLQVISHVRKSDSSRRPAEEGGRVKIDDLKGSGAVKQWANMVVALERNQQAEDEEEARTTTVRILKARGVGKNVGRTVHVKYLPDTAQLLQTDGVGQGNYGEDPF